MVQPKKQVRTLHDRLKIIQEVEKNPGEKRVCMAKRLRLAASTLNSIFAKKDEIRQQTENVVTRVRRKKLVRSQHLRNWKLFFTWYQQVRASSIPIDGTTLREKAKIIAAQLNIDNFSVSNGRVSACRFKDRHGLVFKKLAGESAEVSVEY